MDNNVIAICIAQKYFECEINYLYYDMDDDVDIIINITSENENKKNRIFNIKNYVEHIVPSLSSECFKSHFRYVYSNIIIKVLL